MLSPYHDNPIGIRRSNTARRCAIDDHSIHSKWFVAMSLIYPATLILLLGIELALQAMHML
jgi:hypothetical protein